MSSTRFAVAKKDKALPPKTCPPTRPLPLRNLWLQYALVVPLFLYTMLIYNVLYFLIQDVVELEVFNLIQVRIQAPLVTLSVGTEVCHLIIFLQFNFNHIFAISVIKGYMNLYLQMPVYVMGSDSDQNPLSLGSVESGLSFFWSLSKPGVLEIKARHAEVMSIEMYA